MSHHSARFYGRPKPPVQFQFVTSKHQRLPGSGAVSLSEWSGWKKLRRAALRWKLPEHQVLTIQMAMSSAEKRRHRYMHRAERQRAADVFMAFFDIETTADGFNDLRHTTWEGSGYA